MKQLVGTPLSIIVATDMSGAFGFKGNIPWKDQPFAKDDFKRFQQITKNSVCIMGYKTYQEILEMKLARGGDPNTPLLSNRESFVVSTRGETSQSVDGVTFVPTIRAAVEQLENEDTREIFVLGGEKLFVEALAWTQHIYLSVVKDVYQGDRFFPLHYVNNFFDIVEGEQTDDLFFLKLRRR